MADRDQKRVTFRADEDKVEYLDWLIKQKNAQLGPGSDEEVNRSDLLRDCVDDLIDELESEMPGNRKAAMVTAD